MTTETIPCLVCGEAAFEIQLCWDHVYAYHQWKSVLHDETSRNRVAEFVLVAGAYDEGFNGYLAGNFGVQSDPLPTFCNRCQSCHEYGECPEDRSGCACGSPKDPGMHDRFMCTPLCTSAVQS